MRLKKKISLLMIACLSLGTFIGCGNKEVVDEKKNVEVKKVDEQKVPEVAKNKIIVPEDWVKSVIDGKQEESKNYIIVEGSWGITSENKEYLDDHLPGAIHINTDDIEHDAEEGVSDYDNYNIKSPEDVEKALLANGIDKDTTVIVYGSTVGASRVAFINLWAGVENVKLMDGNIKTWKEKGYPVEKGEVKPKAKTDFKTKVPAHPEWIKNDKEVFNSLSDENSKLISIRSIDEYEGKTSGYAYIDFAGEPKGALWGHAGKNAYDMSDYIKDGHYVDYSTVENYMKEINVTKDNKSTFYCGTGWRACIPWIILHENGWNNITIYDGGWWQWLTNKDYPVQVGDPKKDVKYTTVGELEGGKAVQK